MERQVHTYEYVDAPFDEITELLAEAAPAVLQSATETARTHAGDVLVRLSVPVGGFELGRDVTIEIGEFDPVDQLRVRIPLRWHAASRSALFPALQADLEVSALTLQPPRCQITLDGMYRPPLGFMGRAADAIAGHRIAEAAVHRFVRDVANRITTELASRREGLAVPPR